MGHSTVRAAMVYQHLVGGRDQEIADHVDRLIRKSKQTKKAKCPKRDRESPDGAKIN
ncbi:integrase [Streptomyces lydicus]|uniref:integrase n=1 Tax=Streptomyces lydicus TaxID=47763 RepID=UPI001FCAF6F8|nr:integrase [Streptomyces lydicus]